MRGFQARRLTSCLIGQCRTSATTEREPMARNRAGSQNTMQFGMQETEGRERSGSMQAIATGDNPMALPGWDETATACASCSTGFTMIRRKHHCRLCGGTFCDMCSKSRRALPSFGIMDAARVCDSCASRADCADANGLTSMAIQFSEGTVREYL